MARLLERFLGKCNPLEGRIIALKKVGLKKSPETLNCMLQFQGGRRRRKWVIRDHSKSNLIHYSLRSRRSMAIMWQQLLADKFNSQPLALTLRAVNPPLKAKYVCLGLIQAQKWLLWANQSPAETEFQFQWSLFVKKFQLNYAMFSTFR